MKKRIAITGGIGSGKSTAGNFFKALGYPVFSCDEIYKEVVSSHEYIQKIKELFPSCVQSGKIDRKLLSEIVFENDAERKKLNNLAHPLIMEKLVSEMEKADNDLVFAEVPLLFEGNFENLFDEIIVVDRAISERIKALLLRDQTSETKIKSRIKAQFNYDSEEGRERLKKCNAHIIPNNGSQDTLKNALQRALIRINHTSS